MDIGAAGIVAWIASSTDSSLVAYDPVFLMIGGLVLALLVISVLIGLVGGRGGGDNGMDSIDFDDSIEI